MGRIRTLKNMGDNDDLRKHEECPEGEIMTDSSDEGSFGDVDAITVNHSAAQIQEGSEVERVETKLRAHVEIAELA
jgi:hypothetical protein